jgi:hypothetical protein
MEKEGVRGREGRRGELGGGEKEKRGECGVVCVYVCVCVTSVIGMLIAR